MFLAKKGLVLVFLTLFCLSFASAQSRHNVRINEDGSAVISVVATRNNGETSPIRTENLYLYENGIEQKVKNFSYDPSPARILILVDNSQTFRPDTEKIQQAIMEFAYEIFEGDQLYVIAYDEKPEIIQEWTDDAKKMETSLGLLRKRGNPHLFDALSVGYNEVLSPLMPGTRKTVIVLISDGLDRGSNTSFDLALTELQNNNVTVYALQVPDRTGGAYRRNQPKAGRVITQLTEGTGGIIFPFEESQTAAKTICDELRKNRYLLSYSPLNFSSYDARTVFIVADEGISIRSKNAQPPNIKP